MSNERILVLDDDDQIVQALALVLQSVGYQVIQVTDPGSVDKTIETEKPDLLIIDIRLGSVDGRDLAQEFKSRPEYVNIPIILISARVDNITGDELQGADLYLAKPFRMQALLDAIQGLLHP